jgi:biotin carboxylase
MKKLLLLGGLRYLIPVIKVAHEIGIYVITCDYLPNNIAHRYSDEYINESIIDKEAILKIAKEKKIDGIMSFAVDPGVVTAAYVAEKMGLPFQCSYEAACVLQDKSRFRKFLFDNNFNTPKAKGYSRVEDALEDVDFFNWPLVVKPVDSAGSKGVTKVDRCEDLSKAIELALKVSHSGNFIIEDFIEKNGLSSGSESFVVDGVLKYNGFYDQFFDNLSDNSFTPVGESWPSKKAEVYLQDVRNQVQRVIDLLNIKTGLLNIEWRVCTDGKVYLMEISPRGGGNRLAEMLNYAADVDIIKAEVIKSVGATIPFEVHEPNYKGYFAIVVLHSNKSGIFHSVEISDTIRKFIFEKEIRINKGDFIERFSGANNAIGTLFLKFTSQEELDFYMKDHTKWVTIKLQEKW